MTDRPPSSGIADWNVALEAVEGDPQLLKEVVEAYLEESPRLLSDLHTAISGGDAPLLRRASHTLKSSMRYFGATRLYELAARLESMGREGQLQDAESSLAALSGDLSRLAEELQSFVERQSRAG